MYICSVTLQLHFVSLLKAGSTRDACIASAGSRHAGCIRACVACIPGAVYESASSRLGKRILAALHYCTLALYH